MAAIEVADLTKTYSYHQKSPGLRGSLRSLVRRQILQRRAVDGISFAVRPGEVVGILGPNGADKTTTLKLLCGLLSPTGGRARVLGHDPFRREPAFLRRIALVMGQKSLLWPDLPAMDLLLVHKEMYDLPGPAFRRNLDDLVDLLGVGPVLHVQVRKLSLGERMKLELLAALIHRPEVLFLDEPTIGLDVVSQQRVRDFLRGLNRRLGTTILLTSHDMDDIEELCPRVLLVDRGRLSFDGPLPRLVQEATPDKRVGADFSTPEGATRAAAALGDLPRRETEDPLRLALAVPRDRVPEVAARLLAGGQVQDLSVEEAPVEEIIRRLFSRPPGGEGKGGAGSRASSLAGGEAPPRDPRDGPSLHEAGPQGAGEPARVVG